MPETFSITTQKIFFATFSHHLQRLLLLSTPSQLHFLRLNKPPLLLLCLPLPNLSSFIKTLTQSQINSISTFAKSKKPILFFFMISRKHSFQQVSFSLFQVFTLIPPNCASANQACFFNNFPNVDLSPFVHLH